MIVEFAASWHFFDGVAKTPFHVFQRNTLLVFPQQQCPFYKLLVWWQEVLPLDNFSARLSKLTSPRPEEQFAEQQVFFRKKIIFRAFADNEGKFSGLFPNKFGWVVTFSLSSETFWDWKIFASTLSFFGGLSYMNSKCPNETSEENCF